MQLRSADILACNIDGIPVGGVCGFQEASE
jgi:hypothetical protein